MRVSSALTRPLIGFEPTAGWEIAYAAADRPASAPNTRHSLREFDPRRFAPLIETHAVSPTA